MKQADCSHYIAYTAGYILPLCRNSPELGTQWAKISVMELSMVSGQDEPIGVTSARLIFTPAFKEGLLIN